MQNMFKKYKYFYFSLFAALVFLSCKNAHLKIVVPNGYVGGVCLIKSNVKKNELKIDSNGIGYINEETFNNLYYKPFVFDVSGKDLSANCVGYNSSTFWAVGEAESLQPKRVIHFMSFEIVPDSLQGIYQYYDTDFFKVVDTLKIK